MDERTIKLCRSTLKIVTLWGVWKTEDEMGRRGKVVGYFHRKSDAATASLKQGWYGGTGLVSEVQALELGEVDDDGVDKVLIITGGPVQVDVNLIEQHHNKIQAAKAKLATALTPEEIELLGIKMDPTFRIASSVLADD